MKGLIPEKWDQNGVGGRAFLRGLLKSSFFVKGFWANEHTLEECREVLQEVLEEWLLLKLRDKDPLPLIGGIDLNRMVAEG